MLEIMKIVPSRQSLQTEKISKNGTCDLSKLYGFLLLTLNPVTSKVIFFVPHRGQSATIDDIVFQLFPC